LPSLHARLCEALHDRPNEFLFVDDGSQDDSAQVARMLGARVLQHDRNRGQNAAILTGLRHASMPLTCVLDADLEDPPESVPQMVAALGCTDVVFSSRDESRQLTSRLFRWSVRRLYPTLPQHPCLCFAISTAGRTRLVDVACDADYLPAVIGALRLPAIQSRVARGRSPDNDPRVGLKGSMRWRYAAAMLLATLRLRLSRRVG
jgi:glycosyltransferase involved in cell wall biosynthesis